MDMRKLFNLPPKQPIFEGDPSRPPETREFDIASTSTAPEALDSTAANLTGVSSMALTRAGVEMPADRAAETPTKPPKQRDGLEFEASDLVEHIVSSHRDRRFQKPPRHVDRPRLRRATS